jgi:hypothetical protein
MNYLTIFVLFFHIFKNNCNISLLNSLYLQGDDINLT